MMKSKLLDGRSTIIAASATACVALVWVFWPTFTSMAEQWTRNPLYSHGFLVPTVAVVLLWLRRDQLPSSPLEPSWWALPFLIIGSIMRLAAAHFYLTYPDGCSLLFMLFGAALAVGGWPAIRWTWPSILFLHFMIPFPGFIESNILKPLQRVATICSTNSLQTFGFFAQADGNVIVLSEVDMGIVEACSGLKMISVFVALTVGACIIIQRPFWQKIVIGLSAFPIAVLCNVARITVTGALHEIATHDIAEGFHDYWSAWLMMPMALLLLLLEFKVLDLVFVIDPPHGESTSLPIKGPKGPLFKEASAAV